MDDRADETPNLSSYVDARAALDLRFVEDFLAWKDQANGELFGAPRRPDPLREAILRRMMLLLYDGKVEHSAYYQREMAKLGSPTTIRRELRDLEGYGLVLNIGAGLMPSERLRTWYVEYLRKLRLRGAEPPPVLPG